MKRQGMSIIGILLVIGLAVAVSGCTSTTPTQTPAPANITNTPDTTTQNTAPASTTTEAANVNPVDGSIGTYMGVFDGFPGYSSSDQSIIWVCDKKDHIKMWGYMSDYKANGDQWKDSDLHTVTWNA
jgi:hypothetical protein